MIAHSLIASLSQSHELLTSLLESVPEADTRKVYHPSLAPLVWYFGRAVYLELYWLRERAHGDADLTKRVRHLFARGHLSYAEAVAGMPPADHLMNWALEIFDDDLMHLANPAADDASVEDAGRIVDYLTQALSRIYEDMVLVLIERQLARTGAAHEVQLPLVPRLPAVDATQVDQGHYRIGAREGVVFDNERPPMAVELHNFRIQREPISNAEFLAFLVDGGYEDANWWTAAGNDWRERSAIAAPHHWRRDAAGRWFGVGINGAADLVADDPVHGISRYEAEAFANWAASHGEAMSGAVLQHEFQWEVAARAGHLGSAGRVWEWCANCFEPYAAYETPADPEMVSAEFDGTHTAVRGAALHTQPPIRRASYRNRALPDERHLLSGARLVLPPL